MKFTRILSPVLLIISASLAIFAQSGEKEEDIYNLKIHRDKTSKTKIYIPADLEESFVELKNMLHPKFVEKYKKGEITSVELHMGLGMWMRNNWGLWAGERLAKYFHGLGIFHPDDMSSIILTSFERHLNEKPLELEKQVQGYKDYWQAMKQPKGDEAIFPECAKGVEIKGQLLYPRKEGEKIRVTHFGYCRTDKKLWVFEREKGWFEPTAEMLKRIKDDNAGNKIEIIGNLNQMPKKTRPKRKPRKN